MSALETRRDAFRQAVEELTASGADAPAADALALLSHTLGCASAEILAEPCHAIPKPKARSFRTLLARRLGHEPLARILGAKEFHSLDFSVAPDVFLPRFETEDLADLAVAYLLRCRAKGLTPRLLDLCCGSGVLAVTAAVRVPGTRVVALDRSFAAASLTARNAAALGAADAVGVVLGDLFGPCRKGVFDLIVSNPPYVPSHEIPGLPPEVRDHDPQAALDGGAFGLDFIQRIVEGAPSYLTARGVLLMEMGDGQALRVAAFARKVFSRVTVKPDLGGIPRYLIAERKRPWKSS